MGLLSTLVATFFILSIGSCLLFGIFSNSDNKSNKSDIVSVESGNTDKSKKDIKDGTETSNGDFTIEEQVLWEADGIKLTAKGVETGGILSNKIKVLAENNSDKDIVIHTDAVIINNYMITDYGYIKVTAGNKVNDDISLSTTDLRNAGIDNIGQIEVYLHTSDANTYDKLSDSGCITIKTSDYDKMDTESNINGKTLVEQGGIKIVAQYVDENSFWGAAVLLYIENNSEKNIRVIADDTAVNGFMVDGSFYQDVYLGKKAIEALDIFNSSLKENNITSIDEIELRFKVIDDDYHYVIETDKIKFLTK